MTLLIRAITAAWCVLLLGAMADDGSQSGTPDYSLKTHFFWAPDEYEQTFQLSLHEVDPSLDATTMHDILASVSVEDAVHSYTNSWSRNLNVSVRNPANFEVADLFPASLCGDLTATLNCLAVADKSIKPCEPTKVIVAETRRALLSASQIQCPPNLCVQFTTNITLSTDLTLHFTLADPFEKIVNESTQVLERSNNTLMVQFDGVQSGGYILTVNHTEQKGSLKNWVDLPPEMVLTVGVSVIKLLILNHQLLKEINETQANLTTCQLHSLSNCSSNVKTTSTTEQSTTSTHEPSTTTSTPEPSSTTSTPEPSTTTSTPEPSTTTYTPEPSTTTYTPEPSTTTSTGEGTPISAAEPTSVPEVPTSSTDDEAKGPTTDPEGLSMTMYMKWIVGVGLIVTITVAIIGYVIYRHKDKVIGMVDTVKTNGGISQAMKRNLRKGGKYTKLPRTMQEALHQD